MYQRYAKRIGHTVDVQSIQSGRLGAKMVVLRIEGENARGVWSREGGVHRIQRVPPTERSGRRQTSAVTVAMVADNDADFVLDEREVEVERKRASGNGGQHINKVESAVRLRHIPTGITVQCQDERSQTQNLRKAMDELRYRLAQKHAANQTQKRVEATREQVRNGFRSEHCRTYNFIDGFVADERSGKKTHKLQAVLDGQLELV